MIFTNLLFFYIGVLWLISAFFEYSRYCYIWQLKEYRFDIFSDFLSTKQGKEFVYHYPVMLRSLCIILLFFLLPINTFTTAFYILFVILLADVFVGVTHVYKKRFRRPTLTIKAMSIVLGSLTLEVGIVWFFGDIEVLLLLLLLRFVILSTVVFLSYVPTKILKRCIIFLAKRKMLGYKKLLVIGVTGSYGKTSVKEFLDHILSCNKNVIKTPKNINTDIGIAKFILQNDLSGHDVFVCEMGAYKMGEIAIVCDMVKPLVGILTAINDQHASLFGSIEQTQQAKYELLRAIPEDGLVITNADNPYCVGLVHTLSCKNIQTFGTSESVDISCRIVKIDSTLEYTKFVWELADKKEVKMHTRIIGAHHAFNIAPAILVARYLNISIAEIEKQGTSLPVAVHGSLSIFPYGNATIVNDSYNSNPNGFRSALDVLAKFPTDKRRIVITRGMLELGSRSDILHEEIGGEISFVADGLVVITKDFFAPLQRGIVEKYHTQVSLKDNPQDLLAYITSLKEKDVVILLENRMPVSVMKELGVV